MGKAARNNRIFIDWNQNSDFKTTVGLYSLRAKRSIPYVSIPVSWEELRPAMKNGNANRLYFQPAAALARLKAVGDLFAPVLRLREKLG